MASEAPRVRCARAPGAGEPAAGPEASRVMVKRGFSAIFQLVSAIYVRGGMGRLTLSCVRGDRERPQGGGDALRDDLDISGEGPRGAGDQLGVPLVHGGCVDVNWPELLLGLVHAIGASGEIRCTGHNWSDGCCLDFARLRRLRHYITIKVNFKYSISFCFTSNLEV